MREWKLVETYNMLNYTFCVGVAQDDPHIMGIFAGHDDSDRLKLIHKTLCIEEDKIDFYATKIVPCVMKRYLLQKLSNR